MATRAGGLSAMGDKKDLSDLGPRGGVVTPFRPVENEASASAVVAVRAVEAEGEERLTEVGNGRRFARKFEGRFIFVPTIGWLAWSGTHWQRDEGDAAARQAAKEVATELWAELRTVTDQKLVAVGERHARDTERVRGLKAMLEAASTEPEILRHHGDLDQHAMLLATPSGTVELDTGTLRPARPSDLLTRSTGVALEPGATAPTFDSFMLQVFDNNEEHVAAMLRVLGLCLTGRTRDQHWFFLFGVGGNGKSTLVNCARELLGDYARNASYTTFVSSRFIGDSEAPSPGMARLAGARFITASEPKRGARLDLEKIKDFTGGEPVTARLLRKDPFEYTPAGKLVFVGNHLPNITDTDDGTWRRPVLIPFTVKLEDVGPLDRDFPAKLRRELPGILNRLVQGCLDYQRQGLAPPPEWVSATERLRHESDSVVSFLAECCEEGPTLRAQTRQLYPAFEEWCRESGEQVPVTKVEFGRRMAALGRFDKTKYHGNTAWKGIGLRSGRPGSES